MLTGFEVIHQVGQDHEEPSGHDGGNPVCAEVDELVKHGSFLYSYSIAPIGCRCQAYLQSVTVTGMPVVIQMIEFVLIHSVKGTGACPKIL